MVIFYKISGLIANLALIINIALILSALSLIDATLTLPGIAGIVLTMGMAVDANVLIFERIKEEINNKHNIIVAIDRGFSQAFRTIIDSNTTAPNCSNITLYFWQWTGQKDLLSLYHLELLPQCLAP